MQEVEQCRSNCRDHPVEADGAILLHLALGLEQEQILEIQPRLGETHRLTMPGPLLVRRGTCQSAVRGMMVLPLHPGPQTPVQCREVGGILRAQAGQQLCP